MAGEIFKTTSSSNRTGPVRPASNSELNDLSPRVPVDASARVLNPNAPTGSAAFSPRREFRVRNQLARVKDGVHSDSGSNPDSEPDTKVSFGNDSNSCDMESVKSVNSAPRDDLPQTSVLKKSGTKTPIPNEPPPNPPSIENQEALNALNEHLEYLNQCLPDKNIKEQIKNIKKQINYLTEFIATYNDNPYFQEIMNNNNKTYDDFANFRLNYKKNNYFAYRWKKDQTFHVFKKFEEHIKAELNTAKRQTSGAAQPLSPSGVSAAASAAGSDANILNSLLRAPDPLERPATLSRGTSIPVQELTDPTFAGGGDPRSLEQGEVDQLKHKDDSLAWNPDPSLPTTQAATSPEILSGSQPGGSDAVQPKAIVAGGPDGASPSLAWQRSDSLENAGSISIPDITTDQARTAVGKGGPSLSPHRTKGTPERGSFSTVSKHGGDGQGTGSESSDNSLPDVASESEGNTFTLSDPMNPHQPPRLSSDSTESGNPAEDLRDSNPPPGSTLADTFNLNRSALEALGSPKDLVSKVQEWLEVNLPGFDRNDIAAESKVPEGTSNASNEPVVGSHAAPLSADDVASKTGLSGGRLGSLPLGDPIPDSVPKKASKDDELSQPPLPPQKWRDKNRTVNIDGSSSTRTPPPGSADSSSGVAGHTGSLPSESSSEPAAAAASEPATQFAAAVLHRTTHEITDLLSLWGNPRESDPVLPGDQPAGSSRDFIPDGSGTPTRSGEKRKSTLGGGDGGQSQHLGRSRLKKSRYPTQATNTETTLLDNCIPNTFGSHALSGEPSEPWQDRIARAVLQSSSAAGSRIDLSQATSQTLTLYQPQSVPDPLPQTSVEAAIEPGEGASTLPALDSVIGIVNTPSSPTSEAAPTTRGGEPDLIDLSRDPSDDGNPVGDPFLPSADNPATMVRVAAQDAPSEPSPSRQLLITEAHEIATELQTCVARIETMHKNLLQTPNRHSLIERLNIQLAALKEEIKKAVDLQETASKKMSDSETLKLKCDLLMLKSTLILADLEVEMIALDMDKRTTSGESASTSVIPPTFPANELMAASLLNPKSADFENEEKIVQMQVDAAIATLKNKKEQRVLERNRIKREEEEKNLIADIGKANVEIKRNHQNFKNVHKSLTELLPALNDVLENVVDDNSDFKQEPVSELEKIREQQAKKLIEQKNLLAQKLIKFNSALAKLIAGSSK